jgi:hypothetical protein
MPSDFDVNIKKFFKEIYTYKHSSDGEQYTITIEGNPNDVESTITVVAGENEYKTTLKELDKLPEKYQKAAGQAIKDAHKAAKTRKFDQNLDPQSFNFRPYLDKIRPDIDRPFPRFGPSDEMFDLIKKQMKELQQRLDKLEKWQKKKFDSDESDEPDKPESQQQKDSLPRDEGNEKIT